MGWEFKQEPSAKNRWRWQHVDHDTGSVLKISRVCFRTLYECVKDAEINGYMPRGRSGPPPNHDAHTLWPPTD
jgi:hypothetical protein